ncbi:hypothetical protein CERSUDRAFT_114103 [Gelatoporia subvermispora B]|uniref:Transcriptional activator HAP2 n=1 Tax=Ceriporiopsis subvermispora (strain B) TaxID=914234 RepID=M2QKD8_CERS8|nr:hypothetical protein CERSUDRAFT_114103 [Gelatoporia subvermispora B]
MDNVDHLFNPPSYHPYQHTSHPATHPQAHQQPTHQQTHAHPHVGLYTFYPPGPAQQQQQQQQQRTHLSRQPSPQQQPSPAPTPIPQSPHNLFLQPPQDHAPPHLHHHHEPDRPVDQIQDDVPMDEEPLYVNAKQYYRILKRRVARQRLAELHRLSTQRKPYLHESRHKHAMRRPRGPGGRFLTAEEIAAQKAHQPEAGPSASTSQDGEEDEGEHNMGAEDDGDPPAVSPHGSIKPAAQPAHPSPSTPIEPKREQRPPSAVPQPLQPRPLNTGSVESASPEVRLQPSLQPLSVPQPQHHQLSAPQPQQLLQPQQPQRPAPASQPVHSPFEQHLGMGHAHAHAGSPLSLMGTFHPTLSHPATPAPLSPHPQQQQHQAMPDVNVGVMQDHARDPHEHIRSPLEHPAHAHAHQHAHQHVQQVQAQHVHPHPRAHTHSHAGLPGHAPHPHPHPHLPPDMAAAPSQAAQSAQAQALAMRVPYPTSTPTPTMHHVPHPHAHARHHASYLNRSERLFGDMAGAGAGMKAEPQRAHEDMLRFGGAEAGRR